MQRAQHCSQAQTRSGKRKLTLFAHSNTRNSQHMVEVAVLSLHALHMQVAVRVHDACFTSGVTLCQCLVWVVVVLWTAVCTSSTGSHVARTSPHVKRAGKRSCCKAEHKPYHQHSGSDTALVLWAANHTDAICTHHCSSIQSVGSSICCHAEVLGSMKCDCAEQLQQALLYIRDNAPGVVIYLQQEGRGIGLANKIAAYSLQVRCLIVLWPTTHCHVSCMRCASRFKRCVYFETPQASLPPTSFDVIFPLACWSLRLMTRSLSAVTQLRHDVQEKGYDTVDANRKLGLPDDAREYSSVMNILKDLNIKSVRLIVRTPTMQPQSCLQAVWLVFGTCRCSYWVCSHTHKLCLCCRLGRSGLPCCPLQLTWKHFSSVQARC